jgi:hypothetical protein
MGAIATLLDAQDRRDIRRVHPNYDVWHVGWPGVFARRGTWNVTAPYLAACGVTNFFGNLTSAAFVGDFSGAAVVLGLSPTIRYVASFAGAICVAALLFAIGRELTQSAPGGVGRFDAVLGLIAAPALIGTAFVIMINQPTPMGPAFVTSRAGEGAFWLFATLGALTTPHRPSADDSYWSIRLADSAVAIVAILAVRIMATGILLGH